MKRVLGLAVAGVLALGAMPSQAGPTAEGRYVAAIYTGSRPRQAPDPTGAIGPVGLTGVTFPANGLKPRKIRVVDDVAGTASISVVIGFSESTDTVPLCTDGEGFVDVRALNPPKNQDMYVYPEVYDIGLSCENSATTGVVTVQY